MSESELQREIMKAVTEAGGRVFRNNVGAWEWAPGKWLHYGLCDGSSDLIGWTSTGRFLAIEVKNPGRDTTSKKRKHLQMQFRCAVNNFHGLALQVTSVEEVLDALKNL